MRAGFHLFSALPRLIFMICYRFLVLRVKIYHIFISPIMSCLSATAKYRFGLILCFKVGTERNMGFNRKLQVTPLMRRRMKAVSLLPLMEPMI